MSKLWKCPRCGNETCSPSDVPVAFCYCGRPDVLAAMKVTGETVPGDVGLEFRFPRSEVR